MRVLKFGGSSVDGVDRLRRVAGIVKRARGERVVMVISALRGVTDTLLALANSAAQGRETAGELADLAGRHREILRALAAGGRRRDLAPRLEARVRELRAALSAIAAAGECSGEVRDGVAAAGERLAVVLAAAALGEAGLNWEIVDAAELVVTDSSFGEARVDGEATAARALVRLERVRVGRITVVPGFVGADPVGRTTTLGRGGSDYSAAVLGAALGAVEVEIWTDVPGVLSAPPRWVPWAGTLPRLTYGQARAIARWGGTVLHERTVDPVEPAEIPILVASSLDPSGPRTTIGSAGSVGPAVAVTARRSLVILGIATADSAPAAVLRSAGIPSWDAGVRLGLPQVLVTAGDARRAMTTLAARGAEVAWRREDVGALVLVGESTARALEALRAAAGRLGFPVLAELPAIEGEAAGVVVREHLLRRALLELHQAVIVAGRSGFVRRDGVPRAAGGEADGRRR